MKQSFITKKIVLQWEQRIAAIEKAYKKNLENEKYLRNIIEEDMEFLESFKKTLEEKK